MGETIKSSDILSSIHRLLNIWEQRGVYPTENIELYRNNLNKTNDSTAMINELLSDRKRKKEDDETQTRDSLSKSPVNAKKIKSNSDETTDLNGKGGSQTDPHLPGDPPEPDELINVILSLENSASSDAVVRGKIANLPSEVSDASLLGKIEDKVAAAQLAVQVNEAVALLNDYNARLTTEMENRKKLAVMLKDYLHEQRGLLQQAEQRLDEYSKKLSKIKGVQREIRNHLQNLPDLKQLPDVTGGLAPLPSAGDLFNIR